MTTCVRRMCASRATGRVAHTWGKRYFPNGSILFMTEPMCDVHQVELCLSLREMGTNAFAIPLDHEQRMERARATYAQCSGSEE